MRTDYEPLPFRDGPRPRPAPDRRSAAWIADHARDGRRLLVVRLRSDLRLAPPADGAHRSKPARLAAAPAHSKRFESARPRDARYARHDRALSARRVVGAVRTHPPRSGRCAAAGGNRVGGAADAGAGPLPRELGRAILGRVEPHLRAGACRAGGGSAHADPAVAASPAGGAQHHHRAAARPEQRDRSADRAAGAGYLQQRPAAGVLVPGRHACRDRGHRSVSDPIEPAAVCRARHAFGSTARAGANVDPDARGHARGDRPGAARSARADPDGDGIDARPGGQAGARSLAAAGRFARDRRDRAGGARQRARPRADAPPVDPRGARPGEHDRLVPVHRGKAVRHPGRVRARRRAGRD